MSWKDAALVHAKDQNPKESVGLLLNIKGKEKYYPCRNLSMTSHQCFVLDPEDYVKADNLGSIKAVIHSHPITSPLPSQADLVSCENSGLPWYIVNPNSETWGYCEPTGFKVPLIGREWVWGVTDCWSLVRDWYKEENNIQLIDYERNITPEEFIKNPLFEKYAKDTGFVELEQGQALQKGDVLLMSILHPTLNHVAIFLGDMVLHHLADRLSCREPYSMWLQKCTGKRYRYAS
nr:putative peptidase [uncultured Mediterranean phage uvMED]